MIRTHHTRALGAMLLSAAITSSAYAADGTLDPTFGTKGFASSDFYPDAHGEDVIAVCGTPDGRVTTLSNIGQVANEGAASFGLTRFDPDGAPDAGFSIDGRMRFTGQGSVHHAIGSISCRTDGSVIVGVYEYVDDVVGSVTRIYRVTITGEIDQQFGTNGSLTLDTSYRWTEGTALHSRADGSIVVAGEVSSPNLATRMFVAVASADGKLDPTFNGGYAYFIVDQDVGTDERVNDIATDHLGRILIAGSIMTTPTNRDMAVWRVLPNGQFDPNFSVDGMTSTHFDVGGEHQDDAEWIAIRQNGKILVGGHATGAATMFAAAQFTPDGQLDLNGFGAGSGRMTDFISWNGGDLAASLDAVLMSSGGVVLSGLVGSSVTQEAAMVATRMDATGNRDLDFGVQGFAVQEFPDPPHNFAAAAGLIKQDRRYVLAGYAVTDNLVEPGAFGANVTAVGLHRDEIFADTHEGLGPQGQ